MVSILISVISDHSKGLNKKKIKRNSTWKTTRIDPIRGSWEEATKNAKERHTTINTAVSHLRIFQLIIWRQILRLHFAISRHPRFSCSPSSKFFPLPQVKHFSQPNKIPTITRLQFVSTPPKWSGSSRAASHTSLPNSKNFIKIYRHIIVLF